MNSVGERGVSDHDIAIWPVKLIKSCIVIGEKIMVYT